MKIPTYAVAGKLLGKRAPRIDPRTFKIEKYLTPLPDPPKSIYYTSKVTDWPLYLNSTLGCCVISAAAHMIQEWTAYAGTEQRITDDDVLKGYEDVGGYVPGDPTTNNGCDMITALNYWRQTGFGGHKIYAYASVNPRNEKEVEQATWLFGNLFVGLALPISAQQTTDWEVPSEGLTGDGSPGSWGGHCVPSISNSDKGQTDVTWGGTIWETKGFRRSYCDELYAILTQDWINALTQQAASGFNLAQLQADLAALK